MAGVFATLNTGGTVNGSWGTVDTVHFDQHAFVFPPCSATPCSMYVGNDGGIFFLPGGAAKASSRNGNLSTIQFVGGDIGLDFVSDPRAIGGTQDNGTLLFVKNAPPFPSNPFEWAQTLNQDGGYAYLDQIPGSTNLAYSEKQTFLGAVGPFKSTDFAFDWSLVANGNGFGSITTVAFYPFYTLDRSDDQHLAFAVNNSVYEILAPQSSWYQSSQQFSQQPATNPTSIAIAPCDNSVIYAGLGLQTDPTTHADLPEAVYRTAGAHSGASSNYELRNGGLPLGGVNALTVDCSDPAAPNVVFLAGEGLSGSTSQEVFMTTNGGVSWTNISGNLPLFLPAYSIVTYRAAGTRVIVVSTDAGVFFTTNDGQSWTQFNNGLPNTPVTWLAIDHDQTTIAAFTYGRGAFYANIGGGGLPPDFSVSVSPTSLNISQGSSGNATVTVTSLNGFNQAANLTASGLPSGVTANFVPSNVTPPSGSNATSTLTLSASSTAAAGTSTVTVTGTSGSSSHSTSLSLTVTAITSPNYVGYVDHMGCDSIAGWAADRNRLNTSINVEIYDGSTLVMTVLANVSRPDVGSFLGDNGLHGYSIATPSLFQDGLQHQVHVKFENSTTELTNSPQSLTCSSSGLTETATEVCGQINPGNVSLSCDSSFDVQGSNYDETISTSLAQGETYKVRLFNIDDHESVYVNGNLMPTANYGQDVTVDLTPFMTVGNNTIRLTELNDAGPWTYGFSRIHALTSTSTTLFNESCGQVVPGSVTVSCDATNARSQRLGVNFDQTLTAPFVTGNTYSVRLFNIDDHESIYVNGTLIMTANYGQDITVDLTPNMMVGTNTIRLTETNDQGAWSYGFTVTRH